MFSAGPGPVTCSGWHGTWKFEQDIVRVKMHYNGKVRASVTCMCLYLFFLQERKKKTLDVPWQFITLQWYVVSIYLLPPLNPPPPCCCSSSSSSSSSRPAPHQVSQVPYQAQFARVDGPCKKKARRAKTKASRIGTCEMCWTWRRVLERKTSGTELNPMCF